MTGAIAQLPTVLVTDPVNGVPASGALWNFYENGTSTPKDTYTTSDLSTPHTNPVEADAGGYFPEIWLDGVYSWKLTDADGVLIDEGDDLTGFAPLGNNNTFSGDNTFSGLVTLDGGTNPEHATDSGTDAYVSATNTTPPADGVTITRDFQSANTTTTPALDGKTMTTRDGSALWAGAVSGPHELQYASGTDTYLVLEPNPSIQDDPVARLDTFTQGHIDGLELSNGTDSAHDIDIATGVCSMRDGSGNYKLFQLSSTLTKQIDANWAEGTAAGGFPSGLTLSAGTIYHVFLIGKDDGSVDGGFDTSLTASTLLSDASAYSWFRRVLSVVTDGSSNILGFSQRGDYVVFDAPIADVVDGSITAGSNEVAAMSVPGNQTAILVAKGRATNCTLVRIQVVNGDDVGSDALGSAFGLVQGGTNVTRSVAVKDTVGVNASSQIKYAVTTTGGGSEAADRVDIRTIGWVDDRGGNA